MIPEGFFFLYVIVRGGRAVYVGQTQNPRRRWSDHLSSARTTGKRHAITHAIAKYGEAAFAFDVLPVVFESQWEADKAEVGMIAALRTSVDLGGYNTTSGGSTNYPSLEARSRVAAERKGKPLSSGHVEKMRNAKRGQKHSAEARARMSASHTERWAALTPEQRAVTSENRKRGWQKRRQGTSP